MTAIAKNNLIMGRADLANSETQQDILIQEAKKDRAAFAQVTFQNGQLRKVYFAGCTPNPDAMWMKQIAKNLTDSLDEFLVGTGLTTCPVRPDPFQRPMRRVRQQSL